MIVGSKQPTATYLSPEEADKHCFAGASVWHFASSPLEDGQEPDIVLVGIGVEVTFEVVKAAELLREICPKLRVRVVNVTDLMVLVAESHHPHALTREEFINMFTADRGVIFNYHGYAIELQGLVFGRPGLDRMKINGYQEEGTTTTPFDMMLANNLSRYDVAKRALEGGATFNPEVEKVLQDALGEISGKIDDVRRFIKDHGEGRRPANQLIK